MKLVPEKLNEISFERGKDPRESMNIGKKAQVISELKKASMDGNEVDITEKFMIIPNKNMQSYELDRTRDIAIKYMPTIYSEFVKRIMKKGTILKVVIDDAISSGMSPDEIKDLLVYSNGENDISGAKIYLAKVSRDEEKIREDEENNIYIFIGYTDKVPVTINGKQYYEDKFTVENMIKIDKYDASQLSQVTGMKLRVRYQEHKHPDYGVYMLNIPKEVMDEENYYEIPEHLQEIVEKYKRKI